MTDLLQKLKSERAKHEAGVGGIFCLRCHRWTDGFHPEVWPCPTARALDCAIAFAKGHSRVRQTNGDELLMEGCSCGLAWPCYRLLEARRAYEGEPK